MSIVQVINICSLVSVNFWLQPYNSGASHCDFIYIDLHWVGLDVCVVYTPCHMRAEYIFHHLDLDSRSGDDWYFSAYQGKTMPEFSVWELCTSNWSLFS